MFYYTRSLATYDHGNYSLIMSIEWDDMDLQSQ